MKPVSKFRYQNTFFTMLTTISVLLQRLQTAYFLKEDKKI